MYFIFVRHGHKEGKKYGWKKSSPKPPLTELGKQAAVDAADFLLGLDARYKPELVVTTDTVRTKQTAEIICDQKEFGKTARRVAGGGFRIRKKTPVQKLENSLEFKLARWIKEAEFEENERPTCVLFVGSGTSQKYLRNTGNIPYPDDIHKKAKACVLVYEIDDDGGFSLVTHDTGTVHPKYL